MIINNSPVIWGSASEAHRQQNLCAQQQRYWQTAWAWANSRANGGSSVGEWCGLMAWANGVGKWRGQMAWANNVGKWRGHTAWANGMAKVLRHLLMTKHLWHCFLT